MKRKILSCVLSICLILTMMPSMAFATGEVPVTEPELTPETEPATAQTLDIADGSITITATGYKQGDANVETPYMGVYTITQSGEGSTTNTISVLGGTHHITLDNVNVTMTSGFDVSGGIYAPMQIRDAADVTLHLEGESTVENYKNCHPAIFVEEDTKLHITAENTDAVLNANGRGYRCSGIGAIGYGGTYAGITKGCAAGTIIIENGTVNAIAANQAVAIGGGYSRVFQEIQINGGIVNAEAAGDHRVDGYTGVGIGISYMGLDPRVFPITISGGEVYAKGGIAIGNRDASGGATLPLVIDSNAYVVCDGEVAAGTIKNENGIDIVYKKVSVGTEKANQNVTVAVDDGAANTYYADENGMISVWVTEGTHTFTVDGIVLNAVALDLANGSIVITKTGYLQGSAATETAHKGAYMITQSGTETTANTILVEDGTHYITVENLNMSMAADFGPATILAPIEIIGGAEVTLNLVGDNVIETYREDTPGIFVRKGSKLKVTAVDTAQTLTVNSRGPKSTAIGGNYTTKAGAGILTFAGGTVNATAADFRAAAIGGGYDRGVQGIYITGGIVNANANAIRGRSPSGWTGVGLGSSYYRGSSVISITGGIVNCTGGWSMGNRLNDVSYAIIQLGKDVQIPGTHHISAQKIERSDKAFSVEPENGKAVLENGILTLPSASTYRMGIYWMDLPGGCTVNMNTGQVAIEDGATFTVTNQRNDNNLSITLPDNNGTVTMQDSCITLPQGSLITMGDSTETTESTEVFYLDDML